MNLQRGGKQQKQTKFYSLNTVCFVKEKFTFSCYFYSRYNTFIELCCKGCDLNAKLRNGRVVSLQERKVTF